MTEKTIAELESLRLSLQKKLDAEKNAVERNRMGQFATPTDLAIDLLRYAKTHLIVGEKIRFLDPAVGTGSFLSALLAVFPMSRIDGAVGYEIDPHYGLPAVRLWQDRRIDLRLEDFTEARPPEEHDKFDLLICNPPYVRHQHISSETKSRLRRKAKGACGIEFNGLSGLYCYFLGLSHTWIKSGGLAGWLMPSEFMDVNYGASVKRYLLEKVTLLHIHRFDPNDMQFDDALVSSTVVWFRKAPPPGSHRVRFTYGGSLMSPEREQLVPIETLRHSRKWTHFPTRGGCKSETGPVLGDFFHIKRGLATGSNRFFILSPEQIKQQELPIEAFRPILPSSRYLSDDEIKADREGHPILSRRLFLLDPPWMEDEIRDCYPTLWAYLQEGRAQGIAERYLCRHRKPWYKQEDRPPAPYLCTYLGRNDNKNGRPFRFILNNSKATATNVYLMLYPKPPIHRALKNNPELKRQIWVHLNEIRADAMLREGRVYGGGLHKLEPRELANVPAKFMLDLHS